MFWVIFAFAFRPISRLLIHFERSSSLLHFNVRSSLLHFTRSGRNARFSSTFGVPSVGFITGLAGPMWWFGRQFWHHTARHQLNISRETVEWRAVEIHMRLAVIIDPTHSALQQPPALSAGAPVSICHVGKFSAAVRHANGLAASKARRKIFVYRIGLAVETLVIFEPAAVIMERVADIEHIPVRMGIDELCRDADCVRRRRRH